MRSLWQSTREWAAEVGTAWFAWAIAVLTATVDAARDLVPALAVPRDAVIAGYALAFVAANLKAFHRMRLRVVAAADQAAEAVPDAAALSTSNDANPRVLVPPPPVSSAHAQSSHAALRRLGIVNQLDGRFHVNNYATPLAHDQRGCVVRCVIAANQSLHVPELESAAKSRLLGELRGSTLERWLLDATTNDSAAPSSRVDWTRVSPNTGYVTTLSRPPVAGAECGGSLLSAQAMLQFPIGVTGGGLSVILILDVIECAAETDDPSPRMRLTLGALHALLHDLAATAIDEIAPTVFPLLLDGRPELIGPNFEISLGDRSIEDLLVIPLSFDRPAGARDLPWAFISTPEGSDSLDIAVRNEAIRRGIASMLRQNEYDGIESEIADLVVGVPTPRLMLSPAPRETVLERRGTLTEPSISAD